MGFYLFHCRRRLLLPDKTPLNQRQPFALEPNARRERWGKGGGGAGFGVGGGGVGCTLGIVIAGLG